MEGNKSQQGFFISYTKGSFKTTVWSNPAKTERLPYGWGATISKDLTTFYFTDGNDLFKFPLDSSLVQKEKIDI